MSTSHSHLAHDLPCLTCDHPHRYLPCEDCTCPAEVPLLVEV